MMPIAEKNPLPVSPSDVRLQKGFPPSQHPPSSHVTPASDQPVWSLPGESERGPRSNPRVWQ